MTRQRPPASEDPPSAEIELRPDGYERFRQAVHLAAKRGPMHRIKPKASEDSVVVEQPRKR